MMSIEPHELLKLIKQLSEEIPGSSEMDFRYTFGNLILERWLGWTRQIGKGHFTIEKARKDIVLYDDSQPPLIVAIVETKKPDHVLDLTDVEQLKGYLEEVGTARYAILTNGKYLVLYSFKNQEMRKELSLDLEDVSKYEELPKLILEQIQKLEVLKRENFTELSDIAYFKEKLLEIDLVYEKGSRDIGYSLFMNSLKESLDELTSYFEGLLNSYINRAEKSGRFLRYAFNEWRRWRAFTGRDERPNYYFCRETAYIFVNRLIFARICEDKRLLIRRYLSGNGIIHVLEEDVRHPYIIAFDNAERILQDNYERIYSLNIFDWWKIDEAERSQMSVDKQLDQKKLEDDLDTIFKHILKRLNVFNFVHVNRDLLGHIYEDYLPKRERKVLGEFYTPIPVVHYILDHVDYTPYKNIGEIRILDPACGSGTFLVQIVTRLIQYYLRKFSKRYVDQFTPDEAKMVLESIKRNVYGLDINPFAVHISEINLLFNTIDLYELIRRKYPDYIIGRFNVICTDSLLEAQHLNAQSELGDFYENGRAISYKRDQSEADRVKGMSFSIVVGNPPYVKIQNLDNRETYSHIYSKIAKGNYDIYFLFIDRGLNWLQIDGKLGFINPNRFLNSDSADCLRKTISQYKINEFIDFKDIRVFDASTTYSSILIIGKSDPGNNIVRCCRVARGIKDRVDTEMLEGISKHISEDITFEDAHRWYDIFGLPQNHLKDDIWNIMPKDEQIVFEKLENIADKIFKDVFEEEGAFVGLQTSYDPIYIGLGLPTEDSKTLFKPEIVDSKDYERKCNTIKKEFRIESYLLKKYLRGQDVDKWCVRWRDRYLLFPYHIIGDNAELISEDELKNKYNNAWEYLGIFRTILENREEGRLRGRSDWYKYIYPKNLTKFQRPKLVVQINGNGNHFYFDEIGMYYFPGSGGGSGGYGIMLMDSSSAKDHYYFLALFNSSTLEYYHKHISMIFRGKYYAYPKRYLDRWPLKVDIDNTIKEKAINCAILLQNLHEKCLKLQWMIDIFGECLKDEEKTTNLVDLASQLKLSAEYYNPNMLRLTTMSPSDSSDKVYRLEFKKNDYIEFSDENVAKYIHLLLKKYAKINMSELLSSRFPAKDKIITEMERYRSYHEQILEKRISIDETQKELDDIVAIEIYGLNVDDLEIISKFLNIW